MHTWRLEKEVHVGLPISSLGGKCKQCCVIAEKTKKPHTPAWPPLTWASALCFVGLCGIIENTALLLPSPPHHNTTLCAVSLCVCRFLGSGLVLSLSHFLSLNPRNYRVRRGRSRPWGSIIFSYQCMALIPGGCMGVLTWHALLPRNM